MDRAIDFVVYGDCCSGIPLTPHEEIFSRVNAAMARLTPSPEFIVFLGDHIKGYVDTREELLAQWRHFLENEFDPVRRITRDVYPVAGNHDIYDSMSAAVWLETFPSLPQNGPADSFGRSYYVRRDPLLLVFINTTDTTHRGAARFGDAQWLDSVLTKHNDLPLKFVFGHHPAHAVNGYDQWPLWRMPPDEAAVFWDILSRHGVQCYWCSHIIAFDVQCYKGILQITSGGAGTQYGPGGFMGDSEYHHLVHATLEGRKMTITTVDTTSTLRERLCLDL
jgi:Calcineurin-like phosphoesterase